MTTATIIGILGPAAGALFLWGSVRLVNRGWRPTKRFCCIAVVLMAVGYPAMLGPCCWLSSYTRCGMEQVSFLYSPLIFEPFGECIFEADQEPLLYRLMIAYSNLGTADSDWAWMISPQENGYVVRWEYHYNPRWEDFLGTNGNL